jgi:hypothetical protein
MKRKARRGESRDLRSLRKLAHERAAQIGAPDRPPIDLEEILGVPIGPEDAEPLTPAIPRPERPVAPSATVFGDSRKPKSPPESILDPAASGVEAAAPGIVEAPGQRPRAANPREVVRRSGAGAACTLRLLAELHLRTIDMLIAPVLSWGHIQRQAANCYLTAVRHALGGFRTSGPTASSMWFPHQDPQMRLPTFWRW